VTDLHPAGAKRRMHIAYDFSWPGGGTLASTPAAAQTPNGTYCATVTYSWGTAKNVTDKYTSAHTNSTDCTPVLGSACIAAILSGSSQNDDGSRDGCWDRLWSHYPACADTFGMAEYTPYGSRRLILETHDLIPKYTFSGAPFFVVTAGGQEKNDDADLPGVYQNAVDMLQVVLLKPPVAVSGEALPTLNCMRVNTEAVVDVGESGGEGGSSGGEGGNSGSEEGQDDSEEGQGGSEGNTEDGNSGAGRDAAASGLWALMGSLAVALL
jgi:hypothetical protein